MKNIVLYLKEYGLFGFFNKSVERILKQVGFQKTITCFYKKTLQDNMSTLLASESITFTFLNSEMIDQFNKIKYFSFIDGISLLNSRNHEVVLAIKDNKICGYLVLHFGRTTHEIHNLGNWWLDQDEAWLGPTYVVKEHRGEGINSLMLDYASAKCREEGIWFIYTCINKKNIASIKSFTKNGFQQIGTVEFNGRKNRSQFQSERNSLKFKIK